MQKDVLPGSKRYAYGFNDPANVIDPYGRWGVHIHLPKPSIQAIQDWTSDRLHEAKANTIDAAVEGARSTVHLITNSYYDLNVTLGCGGRVLSVGFQFDKGGGYGYQGVGTGSCGITTSLNVAPNQQVTTGLNCGVSGNRTFAVGDLLIGPFASLGYGGIPKEGLNGYELGTGFWEGGVSIGTSGSSAVCTYVRKFWSW